MRTAGSIFLFLAWPLFAGKFLAYLFKFIGGAKKIIGKDLKILSYLLESYRQEPGDL